MNLVQKNEQSYLDWKKFEILVSKKNEKKIFKGFLKKTK